MLYHSTVPTRRFVPTGSSNVQWVYFVIESEGQFAVNHPVPPYIITSDLDPRSRTRFPYRCIRDGIV
jgi:hypothetical protein